MFGKNKKEEEEARRISMAAYEAHKEKMRKQAEEASQKRAAYEKQMADKFQRDVKAGEKTPEPRKAPRPEDVRPMPKPEQQKAQAAQPAARAPQQPSQAAPAPKASAAAQSSQQARAQPAAKAPPQASQAPRASAQGAQQARPSPSAQAQSPAARPGRDVAQRSAGAQSRAASNAPREYRAGNPEAVRAAKQRSAEITAQRAPAQVQQQQRTQQKASPSK